jgi:hypothetical protein
MPFTVGSTLFSVLAIYFLARSYRKSVATEKRQIGLMLAGIFLMLTLIILTILIPVVVFNSLVFLPFTPLYVLVFLGLTAYAITKYHLFNIKVLLTQALIVVIDIVLFAKLFGETSVNARVVDLLVLVFMLVFGFFLVRSVRREVAQYEKDLAGAFNEPVGITHDANQREVSFTMGEYLDAQVAANDAVRARENFAAQAGNRSSVNRLAQLADEEAQQHIGIVQDLARSATQGGALSKAALTGIQTGATQMPVHPERAAIQQQMLADEAAQAELDPIELFMRGRNERQLQNLSAPGHSQATRQAATAEIERRMTEPVQNIAGSHYRSLRWPELLPKYDHVHI